MARLIWRHPDGNPDAQALNGDVVVGRGSDLGFVVDRKSVSRRHARILWRRGEFVIQDLKSTNGTLVNGVRISGPTVLNSGDVIQVGDELLEFDDGASGGVTTGSLVTEPMGGRVRHDVRRVAFPQRVGKFHLRRKLGQGGMGAVFQSLDVDFNREVAVKFIRAQIGRREAFLDYFYNREAVLAREVNHPNVIRVYEHGVHADQHYISMEYVSGANLSRVLRDRRLAPRETLEILRQIACGLVAAHQKGVVHSDIKPANILLADELALNCSRDEFDPGPTEDELPPGILEFDLDDDSREKTVVKAPDLGLLREIRSRIGATAPDALVDPPYFARSPETRFLQHYLERAFAGRGYFLLVEGESGAGKDRLISEFLDPAALNSQAEGSQGQPGARVLELDCARIEGIPRLYSEVFPDRPASTKTSREMVRELAEFLGEEELPCVIRILNLGSVTALGSDLLRTLAKGIDEKPLALVAALSPEQIRANGSLKPLLERLVSVSKSLYLRPLTEFQILKYVQQIYGDDPVAAAVATDVFRLSGGNFSRVLDILRGFFERGILSVDSPSGELRYRPRKHEFELEEGKNLYEKYRSLGSRERRLLEHAAFIGRRFPFELLQTLSTVNETSLFFIVRTLLGDGFFEEEGGNWYCFTNRSFQQYMADRVPSTERPHLHRKVARLLGNTSVPESAELLAVRARHFDGCREYGKAVQALLEGAYLARNEYRIEISREMFQEILRIYRHLASRRKVRREVTNVLRGWFRRDRNWYELLGELSTAKPKATVKIADFGISFRQEDEDRGYQVERRPALGTPRYLSPERIRGEHGGTPCDLFALGIILYEMVTGEPPFPELKRKDLLAANRTEPIRLSSEDLLRFPEGTERLLAHMVEKEPGQRWDAERVVREVGKLQLDLEHDKKR